MKYNDIESLLKEYFDAEEKSLCVPEKENIKAFAFCGIAKKAIRIKVAALIAACLAMIISASYLIASIKRDEPSIPEISHAENSRDTAPVIADWYKPGEFRVELTAFTSSGKAASGAGGFENSANSDVVLPEWVTHTYMLNERYIELRYDHHYKNPFYDEGLIVYDLKKKKVRSIISDIYEKNKEFFTARNPYQRLPRDMISVCEFGKNSEWGIFNVWNDAVFPTQLEQFLINVESGQMTKLADRRNIIGASKNYDFVVRMGEVTDADGRVTVEISVLNTITLNEKVIYHVPLSSSLLSNTAEFSKNGRYIIYKTNDQMEAIEPFWIIYDTETESIQNGYGDILSFTEDGLSMIVYANGNYKILTLDGLKDITAECELPEHEYYRIVEASEYINRNTKEEESSLLLCREPIFGKGERTVIAKNVDTYIEWNGYYYIYIKGADDILIYSVIEDESFLYDISDTDVDKIDFHSMSIYVLEDGRKCNIVTFFDNHLGNYEIVIGEIKKPTINEIELPFNEGETASYGEGSTIFDSMYGHKLTVTEAYRDKDALYFNALERDYTLYLGAGFTIRGLWFIGLEYCGDVCEYDYRAILAEPNDIVALNYAREFELELQEDFNSSKGYHSVSYYTVYDKDGNVIRRG